jgi:hypothetical protein
LASEAQGSYITNQCFSNTLSDNAQVIFLGAGGTIASPTTTLSGKALGWFSFRGHDSNALTGSKAALSAYAEADWTTISTPTRLVFHATPSGSTTNTEVMRITSAGNIGLGTTSFGTSLAKGISIGNGTAASAAATTATQLWSSTDGLNIAYTITNKWVIGDKFGAFNATAVVKQTGCAVPTDLATAITAITALRTALNNYGLTTIV